MKRAPALACVATALLAAAAAGGEPPPLPLGPILRRAKASGALERVLGVRYFLLEDPRSGEAVLRVHVLEAEDPPCLVVDVGLTTLGQRPGVFMNTQVLVGWDGAVQAFRVHRRFGEEKETHEWRVVEGELRRLGEEPEVREWEPEAVSGLVLMFVVPALYDQGLPLPCRVVQLDENAGRCSERLLTGEGEASDPQAAGPRFVSLTLRHDPHHEHVQHEITVVEDGRIQRLRMPGGATMTAISTLEAERRLAEAFPDAGRPTPLAPPFSGGDRPRGGEGEGGEAHDGGEAPDGGGAPDGGDAPEDGGDAPEDGGGAG